MGAGPITEQIQRESNTQVLDWKDAIYTKEAVDHPFLTMVKTGKKPVQIEANWPIMTRDIGAINGMADGAATTTFGHQGRTRLKSVSQELREAWKVTNQAEVTDTWGVKDEVQFQKAEALIRLRLKLERLFLSTQDIAREGVSGATENLLRGVGRWLEPDAADLNAEYPIPDGYRVSSSCLHTGALSALYDSTFEAMLAAAANQRARAVTIDLFASLALQAQMADWTQHDPNISASIAAVNRYNIDLVKQGYINLVQFFTFHAGKVRTHTSYNLFYTPSTGAVSTQTTLGGYGLDMENGWEVRFNRAISHQDLPNDGGGPRGQWLTILTLACQMPAGQLVVYPSGA